MRGIPGGICDRRNGTGRFLFRQLQRNGIPFAVGILGKNDIDYPAAEALAVQVIAAEAYQDFEREHYEAAKQVMRMQKGDLLPDGIWITECA